MGAGGAGARSWNADAAPEQCGLCKKTTLRFDTVIPLGAYDAGLRDAVLRMKRPAHDPAFAGHRAAAGRAARGATGRTRGGPDCARAHVLVAAASPRQEQS